MARLCIYLNLVRSKALPGYIFSGTQFLMALSETYKTLNNFRGSVPSFLTIVMLLNNMFAKPFPS